MKKSLITITLIAFLFGCNSSTKKSENMKSTESIAREFFDTFGTNQDWQSLLTEDFIFSSPMDETSGKDAFIPLDIQFRQLVRSASVMWIISEGEKASALVSYEMALPTGDTLRIEFSEFLEVKGQKIKSIKVFFDTAKFYEFMAKMPKN